MAHRSFKERMNTLAAMAESKVKMAAKTPIPKNVKNSKLWSLVCLAREVSVDADGIQDYSDLVVAKKGLESEVHEKSKEILRLTQELAQHKEIASNEKSLLIREFGDQYKSFAEKTAVLETYRDTVARLQAELESMNNRDKSQRDELAALDSNARTTQTTLNRLQKKMEAADRDCMILRSQLQAAQQKCDDLETRLRTDLGHDFFHEIDETRVIKLREKLDSLSKESCKIVKEFISATEPSMTSATLLQNLQNRFPCLPQPAGLTKEAVLMRRAAAQAIICEVLMTHIFRPFYILDSLKDPASQMLEFFSEDKEQQQIYRYQINRLVGDEETEPTREAVVEAGVVISVALDRLVSPTRLEDFRHRIEDFLSQAAQMWVIEAQQASDLMVVTTPGADKEPPETYQEYGTRNPGKAGSASHQVAATLFPRITLNGQTLHVGQVVWSDSPAAMVARDQIPSPTLSRAGTIRKNGRRNSMVGHPAGQQM